MSIQPIDLPNLEDLVSLVRTKSTALVGFYKCGAFVVFRMGYTAAHAFPRYNLEKAAFGWNLKRTRTCPFLSKNSPFSLDFFGLKNSITDFRKKSNTVHIYTV